MAGMEVTCLEWRSHGWNGGHILNEGLVSS